MNITAAQVQDLRERTGLGMMKCKKALMETDGNPEAAIELLRKQGQAVAAKKSSREAKDGKVIIRKNEGSVIAVEIPCETDFVAVSDDYAKFSEQILDLITEHNPTDIEALKALEIDGKSVESLNTDLVAKLGENISIRRFLVENIGPNEMVETYIHGGGKIGVIVKMAANNQIEVSEKLSELTKDIAMQVAACNPISIDPDGVPADVLDKEREIYREQTRKEGKPENILDRIVEGRVNKYFQENCLVNQIFVKNSKLKVGELVDQAAKELKIDGLKITKFFRLQLGQ